MLSLTPDGYSQMPIKPKAIPGRGAFAALFKINLVTSRIRYFAVELAPNSVKKAVVQALVLLLMTTCTTSQANIALLNLIK